MYYNSHKYKLSYIPIPKNGSTSIQNALGSSESEKTIEPLYSSFVVVREPMSRFISGCNELNKRGIFKGTPQELLDKIQSDGFFDPHIRPQTSYFDLVDNVNLLDNLPFPLPHLNQGNVCECAIDVDQFESIYHNDVVMWCKYGGGHLN